MELQGIKERLEQGIARSVSQLFDELNDIIPYVGMAWQRDEHDDAENVLEGCLLVVANSHEEAYDEIVRDIREFGDDEQRYSIVIRRVK
jgi:hypothetical protein